MKGTSKRSRTVDFVFGIPLLLIGAYAIGIDVFTLILEFTGGVRSLWVVPTGTLLGALPFTFGCYLIFRRRPPANPPDGGGDSL